MAARHGGEVASDIVETIASITTSLKKIIDITSVINGIALKTNILALNVAVEAVPKRVNKDVGLRSSASEVRNLA
ncbi:MAG: methyl-accepting chemotaxis protein [Symbiopectobacterium sp.]